MKLIYIEWCDAMENQSNWSTKDEIIEWADNEDWIVCHTGWIVKETKEYILIAGEVCNSYEQLGNCVKIPKTWIRKRIDLTNSINN